MGCHSQICRRLNKLDITNNRMNVDDDYDIIIIAADSTDIKVTNIGEWMR
jgi:hypothetical protein